MNIYASASRNAPRSFCRRLSTQPNRVLSLPHRNPQLNPARQAARFHSSDVSSSDSPALSSSPPEATTTPLETNEILGDSDGPVSAPATETSMLGTDSPATANELKNEEIVSVAAEHGVEAGNVRTTSVVGADGNGGIMTEDLGSGEAGSDGVLEESFKPRQSPTSTNDAVREVPETSRTATDTSSVANLGIGAADLASNINNASQTSTPREPATNLEPNNGESSSLPVVTPEVPETSGTVASGTRTDTPGATRAQKIAIETASRASNHLRKHFGVPPSSTPWKPATNLKSSGGVPSTSFGNFSEFWDDSTSGRSEFPESGTRADTNSADYSDLTPARFSNHRPTTEGSLFSPGNGSVGPPQSPYVSQIQPQSLEPPNPPKPKPKPDLPNSPSEVPPILAPLKKIQRRALRVQIMNIRDQLKFGTPISREQKNMYYEYLEGGAVDFWDQCEEFEKSRGIPRRANGGADDVETIEKDQRSAKASTEEGSGGLSGVLEHLERLHQSASEDQTKDPWWITFMKKEERERRKKVAAGAGVGGVGARLPKKWESGWGKDELTPMLTEAALDAPPERSLKKEPRSMQEVIEQEAGKKKKQGQEQEDQGISPKTWQISDKAKSSDRTKKDAGGSLPRPPFEGQPSFLMYKRRIEGLLEPDAIDQALEEIQPPTEQRPVAQLEHNLEKVLFNPGVHWLQDPRSRVFNFPPYLQDLPSVSDFAFERVDQFTRPSQDSDIHALLKKHNKKFSGSTSSLTGILCHLYFLISGDRLVITETLSSFRYESRTFTPGQRMPISVVFKRLRGGEFEEGGVESGNVRYVIDSSGSGESQKNILTWMGTMLEKFVTMPKEQFAGYLRSSGDNVALPEKSDKREAFRFSKTNNFILRSQLDCHDPRLPGSGVFDIKTRACIPIRMDIFNYEESSGYLIRTQHGRYESFEREYYDLIRSAFLKYQFQARIGGMDGVIVAYHNTRRVFGFQYIPLEEMDEKLFGRPEGAGDRMFKGCVGLMENVAEEVVGCFPNLDVKATFETQEGSGVMNVFVEPAVWESSLEPRPMKQLRVKTWNYLDSATLTKSWEAFRELNRNWTIRWAVGQLNLSTSEIRENYLESRRRQLRAWAMPTGVDPEDIQTWYENLNFGGREGEDVGTFRPETFMAEPAKHVNMLRELARKGSEESERVREEEAGKPQYVLGE